MSGKKLTIVTLGIIVFTVIGFYGIPIFLNNSKATNSKSSDKLIETSPVLNKETGNVFNNIQEQSSDNIKKSDDKAVSSIVSNVKNLIVKDNPASVVDSIEDTQRAARDIKRQTDLKTIQAYLEIYYNNYGHYPGDKNGASALEGADGTFSSWENFRFIMQKSGIVNDSSKDIPNDPSFSEARSYYYSSNIPNSIYVLGAKMENNIPSNSTNGVINGVRCKTDIYCVTN